MMPGSSRLRLPVVLLACGSFNPPTNMHLRMFERARDYLQKVCGCQVHEGVISPVNDGYQNKVKKELVTASHRVKMLEIALETSSWIRVDTWECSKSEWCRTLSVLRHVRDDLTRRWSTVGAAHPPDGAGAGGGASSSLGDDLSKAVPHLMLLVGADFLETFAVPNLWDPNDIEEIVRDFGLIVITRLGCDPQTFVYESDILSKYQHNIHIVNEWVANEISSTRIRRAIRRGESVKYLVPDKVISYICQHQLYSQQQQQQPTSNMTNQHMHNYKVNVNHAESQESTLSSDSVSVQMAEECAEFLSKRPLLPPKPKYLSWKNSDAASQSPKSSLDSEEAGDWKPKHHVTFSSSSPSNVQPRNRSVNTLIGGEKVTVTPEQRPAVTGDQHYMSDQEAITTSKLRRRMRKTSQSPPKHQSMIARPVSFHEGIFQPTPRLVTYKTSQSIEDFTVIATQRKRLSDHLQTDETAETNAAWVPDPMRHFKQHAKTLSLPTLTTYRQQLPPASGRPSARLRHFNISITPETTV